MVEPVVKPFSASTPRLAIPLGDPAGVGPEVILKALTHPDIADWVDITVVGHRGVVNSVYEHFQQQDANHCRLTFADPSRLKILEEPAASEIEVDLGQGTAATGAASFAYLSTAIAATLQGKFDGIVTGPIAKSAWWAAGHCYPGQTERLAEGAGVSEVGMFFVGTSPYTGWQVRMLLATTHIPLSAVPQQLSPTLLTTKLRLLRTTLQRDFGIEHPRIAIAGLNPHSGEQGQLGREEVDELIPWVEAMRSQFSDLILDGPIPPDTLWVAPAQAWYGSRDNPRGNVPTYDAYLALYHDQGLIPVKLMAFDRAVNTTIGLPFVRTSPDHGTAFDIAGQGIADPTSMIAAIQLAAYLVRKRQVTPPTS
jgi:4-hydroxythreonine-4-phosphate dehydrogenase